MSERACDPRRKCGDEILMVERDGALWSL